MTNKNRVVKALGLAPKTGLTIAGIAERDLSGKLTAEKVEVAVEQLMLQGRVGMITGGRYVLPR
jgi:hypothetical protein